MKSGVLKFGTLEQRKNVPKVFQVFQKCSKCSCIYKSMFYVLFGTLEHFFEKCLG